MRVKQQTVGPPGGRFGRELKKPLGAHYLLSVAPLKMVLIHEFRVPLHMTVDEFQIAQLYMVVDASEKMTGDGEGVEILKNEPYDNTDGHVSVV